MGVSVCMYVRVWEREKERKWELCGNQLFFLLSLCCLSFCWCISHICVCVCVCVCMYVCVQSKSILSNETLDDSSLSVSRPVRTVKRRVLKPKKTNAVSKINQRANCVREENKTKCGWERERGERKKPSLRKKQIWKSARERNVCVCVCVLIFFFVLCCRSPIISLDAQSSNRNTLQVHTTTHC